MKAQKKQLMRPYTGGGRCQSIGSTNEGSTYGLVYKTSNYSWFKKFDWNRKTEDIHIRRLIQSYEEIGQIPIPIVVTSEGQIIDGQHRFEAAKEVGLPIYYIINDNITAEQCEKLNIISSKWKVADKIHSRAERGNINYVRLEALVNSYKNFSPNLIAAVASHITVSGGAITGKINAGTIEISEEELSRTSNILDYLDGELIEVIRRKKGKISCMIDVIIFCYEYDKIDSKKLKEKIINNYPRAEYVAPAKTIDAVSIVQDIYNYRSHEENKVYFFDEWKKQMKARSNHK